jgi:hypothetical protein
MAQVDQKPAEHPTVAESASTLGDLYRLQGRYEEAEPPHSRFMPRPFRERIAQI